MKLKQYLVTALLAGLFAASSAYADAAKDHAVSLAANTETAVEEVADATYAAIETRANDAADVVKSVLGAREKWTLAELYYICRAALLADGKLDLHQCLTGVPSLGLTEQQISQLLNSLNSDALLKPNYGSMGDEQLRQHHREGKLIPTPEPVTPSH